GLRSDPVRSAVRDARWRPGGRRPPAGRAGRSTGVQIGTPQHLPVGGGGQAAEQFHPDPGQTWVQGLTGGAMAPLELGRPLLTHGLQRPERETVDRGGPQLAQQAGRDTASGMPGVHRSSSRALVAPHTTLAYSRTAPLPSQTRRPSASCTASSWRQATLRTSSRPVLVRTGATHAYRPPGWYGGPSWSDQLSARSATVWGRSLTQARNSGVGSGWTLSTRFTGRERAAMTP